LYALRQELGAEVVRSESILSVDPAVLTSDIAEFREAIAQQDRARASVLVTGMFLQDFRLPGFPEFDRWMDEERMVVGAAASRVLVALAKQADLEDDRDGAVESWRRLTMLDPLSGRYALGFLKALAARGDRAGALAFARAHGIVVRRELDTDPDPEIRQLEAELRAMPAGAVVRAATPGPVASGVTVTEPDETPAAVTRTAPTPLPASARRSRGVATVVAVGIFVVAVLLNAGRLRSAFGGARPEATTFAVGLIREEGVPDKTAPSCSRPIPMSARR
jgi:DNA-binding SARP family transcriptional activator